VSDTAVDFVKTRLLGHAALLGAGPNTARSKASTAAALPTLEPGGEKRTMFGRCERPTVARLGQ
jgi:hypothetical protein